MKFYPKRPYQAAREARERAEMNQGQINDLVVRLDTLRLAVSYAQAFANYNQEPIDVLALAEKFYSFMFPPKPTIVPVEAKVLMGAPGK